MECCILCCTSWEQPKGFRNIVRISYVLFRKDASRTTSQLQSLSRSWAVIASGIWTRRGKDWFSSSSATLIVHKRKFEEFASTNVENDQALVAKIAAACHPADFMRDMGYSCCQSVSVLKDLLRQFPELSEADVAKILSMTASSQVPPTEEPRQQHEKQEPKWNIDVLVTTINELVLITATKFLR